MDVGPVQSLFRLIHALICISLMATFMPFYYGLALGKSHYNQGSEVFQHKSPCVTLFLDRPPSPLHHLKPLATTKLFSICLWSRDWSLRECMSRFEISFSTQHHPHDYIPFCCFFLKSAPFHCQAGALGLGGPPVVWSFTHWRISGWFPGWGYSEHSCYGHSHKFLCEYVFISLG